MDALMQVISVAVALTQAVVVIACYLVVAHLVFSGLEAVQGWKAALKRKTARHAEAERIWEITEELDDADE